MTNDIDRVPRLMPSRKKRHPVVARPSSDPGKPTQRQGASKRDPKSLADRRRRLLLSIILGVTALAYFNSLDGKFVYDDRLQVVKNPAIKDLANVPKMFTQSVWQFLNEADKDLAGPYYRPLFNIALTF